MYKFFFNVTELITSFIEPEKEHIGRWLAFWLSLVIGLSALVEFWNVMPYGALFSDAFQFIGVLMPFFMPILAIKVLFNYYMRYIQSDWIKKEGSVLLEIKIPKETNRSPLAMEIFFTSLYQTGSATLVEAFWKGKMRPWFSFEMVSIGGEIHFFIWAFKKWKNLIEAQLYAQYPTVEIHEVGDYTQSVIHDPDNQPFWATYFKLEKEDVYPIKTYVDYGLDKDPKEEFKIDPMATTLDALANVGPGEHMWIQFVITPNKDYDWKTGSLTAVPDAKVDMRTELKKVFVEKTKRKDAEGNEKEVEEQKRASEMTDLEK